VAHKRVILTAYQIVTHKQSLLITNSKYLPQLASPEQVVRPVLVRPELVRPVLVRPELVRPELVRPALVLIDLVHFCQTLALTQMTFPLTNLMCSGQT